MRGKREQESSGTGGAVSLSQKQERVRRTGFHPRLHHVGHGAHSIPGHGNRSPCSPMPGEDGRTQEPLSISPTAFLNCAVPTTMSALPSIRHCRFWHCRAGFLMLISALVNLNCMEKKKGWRHYKEIKNSCTFGSMSHFHTALKRQACVKLRLGRTGSKPQVSKNKLKSDFIAAHYLMIIKNVPYASP